jgi:hypothetical protein
VVAPKFSASSYALSSFAKYAVEVQGEGVTAEAVAIVFEPLTAASARSFTPVVVMDAAAGRVVVDPGAGVSAQVSNVNGLVPEYSRKVTDASLTAPEKVIVMLVAAVDDNE